MSKLSSRLKALINAPHARAGPVPSSQGVAAVYRAIARDAAVKGIGLPAWLTISTAATVTLNSPDSLLELHRVATASATDADQHVTAAAELMREVGLKCISFNGIPRTINCLGAFYTGLPREVSSRLSTTPTRALTESTLPSRLRAGMQLWKSIYDPLDEKLSAKLARSHPDLPVHIHQSHYAMLLANPSAEPESATTAATATATATAGVTQDPRPAQRVGRVLTSLTGIACLRAQTGVGPQVLSHVFGLRKAFEDGSAEGDLKGGEWLASDEGGVWVLECVDRIVQALGGATFAPALVKAKL